MKLLLFTGLVALLASAAHAMPTGAPSGACASITPVGHTSPANTANQSVAPQLSSNFPGNPVGVQYYYCPETQYTLTLQLNDSSPFRGLLVQARDTAGTPVGTFSYFDNLTQAAPCTPQYSAVTHNSRVDKTDQNLTWTAPSSGIGSLYFRYAIVVRYASGVLNQWYSGQSPMIQEGGPLCPTTAPTTQATTASSAGVAASLLTLLLTSLGSLLF